ncbi:MULTISPECIES: flavohemoglobin expression-modulating QEGLA motif protein [Galbibacter]|uniref:flavohemoglobin expression-modulating QEGLA motif protein n=1 Tax=Galbibacter orientalis TaxID=453852 RepID=UPI003002009D
MLEFKKLGEKQITKIITILDREEELNCGLPGGGLLHIEPRLPYMVVSRSVKKRKHLQRIVINEASYLLIGNKDFKKYQKLIIAISDVLSSKYKSFLILEIFLSKKERTSFKVKGPEDILPAFLKTLNDALNNLALEIPIKNVTSTIKNTTKRQPAGKASLLTIDKAKQCGALLVGLEVPLIFYDNEGEFYPVFFRKFKDALIDCIHKSIFQFIRVQTSCGVQSYLSLGRSSLKDKVFEVDRELSKIESSYKFLWLISPSNIFHIKKTFFESGYNKILKYHYRLLPIDPDILKRKLYNLKIEEIDDPAMSHLFRQKREELDLQISMLSERGTSMFFHHSIRLYNGIEPSLYETAKTILSHLSEEIENDNNPTMDALEFSAYARKEFAFFKAQDSQFKSKIHLRKDVNIMMVNQGELYIPADYKAHRIEAKALIQHELGTHVLTYYNGSKQPLKQLATGLTDYDILQEGVAVMSEYLSDGLTVNRLRVLAGRVIAGKALIDGGDFKEIFNLLFTKYGFSKENAFNITSRIMQGGGFLKDIIYLKGLIKLQEYLVGGGNYELLFAGKFGFNHIHIIRELIERNVLHTGILKPSYLYDELYEEKLTQIKNGIPIYKMAKKLTSISNSA